jgi:hypothetical protein
LENYKSRRELAFPGKTRSSIENRTVEKRPGQRGRSFATFTNMHSRHFKAVKKAHLLAHHAHARWSPFKESTVPTHASLHSEQYVPGCLVPEYLLFSCRLVPGASWLTGDRLLSSIAHPRLKFNAKSNCVVGFAKLKCCRHVIKAEPKGISE